MQTLNPYKIPLESINLIEASAGTGKSWTVTYLYLRLILEKNLTVDQILVVTFTDAATKELREDIRDRIIAALEAFQCALSDAGYVNEDGSAKDDEYSQLIENSVDAASADVIDNSGFTEALRRLNRAKLSMDEAAIFTIHGFCQRSLNENAFEAALPFESELLEDDSELMLKLTDDFWRKYTQDAPKSLIFKLHQKSITPDSLLRDIKRVVSKPYLTICGPEDKSVNAEKWDILEQSFNDIRTLWQEEGRDVTRILLEDKNLNGNKFRKPTVSKLCDAMHKVTALYDINEDFLKLAEKFKQSYLVQGTKNKCFTPEHVFFEEWELFSNLWEFLNQNSDHFLNTTRIALIHYLQEALPKEKQRLGVLSFDDLLLQFQYALNNQKQLAVDLREKYQAALIDEFQDTDPIQYDIFRTIYHDSNTKENAVFFVGDPKQAIYSFRGGDIHTYLRAKADTSTQHTLKKNWRSHPDLIHAFNTLYSLSDNPFKDNDIAYVDVESGDLNTQLLETTQNRSSLNFWEYEFDDDGISVGTIRKDIAVSIAGDIAQTLNDGLEGKAKIGDKAISGGDIAILIRSHNQADLIKKALNARGIPSVQNSRASIYSTHEANEIVYLLEAILSPQQEDLVRRALVTEFMGYNGDDLIAFQENSNAWEDKLLAMQNWHQQWKKQGFLPMMRSLMKAENTHQGILNFTDGERRISNILQLSELIHQAARNKMLGMAETVRWLQKQQINANTRETELRLESDEDLVKIVTIHKSKGLEYPIVYCPFVGMNVKSQTGKIFTFNKNGKACLEIGSKHLDEHKELKAIEESAEDTRLLYVALTRAKYQCNVVCISEAVKNAVDQSALGGLLTNGTSPEDKDEFYASYKQNLHYLAASDTSISLEPLPEYPRMLKYNNQESTQERVVRTFKATIKSQAQMTSFSGLTSGAHDETPDYDSIADQKSQSAKLSAKLSKTSTDDEFPRGATAGTALHEIFEYIDFEKPVSDQSELVNQILAKYAFEEKYQTSAQQLIQQSLDARLFDVTQNAFSLKQLDKSQRLDEMEFYLPLERLHIDDLRQILYQHLPRDNPHWQHMRDAIEGLYFEEVEGFLKGYIDLIFEHNGQYYLADYKSNSLEAYDEKNLFEAMAHSHYYLQYLFYSVALHRYLKQRIADYSWETHIGGAYYLFIRGMIEGKSSDNGLDSGSEKAKVLPEKWGGGVFYDKPSLELIEALDGLFLRL